MIDFVKLKRLLSDNIAFRLQMMRGGEWEWNLAHTLPDKDRYWLCARQVEILGKYFLFAPSADDKKVQEFNIYEYEVKKERWKDRKRLTAGKGVNTRRMVGLFQWHTDEDNVVLAVFEPGKILAIDFENRKLHSSNKKIFNKLFRKQKVKMSLKYAFQTARKTNAEGLMAADGNTGRHYFLDFGNIMLGWTPLMETEDPTIGSQIIKQLITFVTCYACFFLAHAGALVPTGNGGAFRYVRRKDDKEKQYRMAVWSKEQERFIETGLEAEEPKKGDKTWMLHIVYDETIEEMNCS